MSKSQSKAAVVRKLLSRGKGATLVEIEKATDWQPHSCRAFLTGVRKTARVTKEQRTDLAIAYRLTNTPHVQSRRAAKPTKVGVTADTAAEDAAPREEASQ